VRRRAQKAFIIVFVCAILLLHSTLYRRPVLVALSIYRGHNIILHFQLTLYTETVNKRAACQCEWESDTVREKYSSTSGRKVRMLQI